MKKLILISGLIFSLNLIPTASFGHCEIPCGIYGDSLRIALLYEHITTIEKSIIQINALSQEENPDYNQLVRWVTNKENHATEIQTIVSQYFLHQRIKISDSSDEESWLRYTKQLSLLHQLQVYAMKSKQSTDLNWIEKLRDSLHNFEHLYFE